MNCKNERFFTVQRSKLALNYSIQLNSEVQLRQSVLNYNNSKKIKVQLLSQTPN